MTFHFLIISKSETVMFSYQNIFNIIVWEICYLLSNRNKKIKATEEDCRIQTICENFTLVYDLNFLYAKKLPYTFEKPCRI